MARIVVRCQSSGHFVFTDVDTSRTPRVRSGRLYCPFCREEHVWQCGEPSGPAGDSQKPRVIGAAS